MCLRKRNEINRWARMKILNLYRVTVEHKKRQQIKIRFED